MQYSTSFQQMGDSPINRIMAQALASPHILSLAAGFVDTRHLPYQAVSQACIHMLQGSQKQHCLQYGTAQGNPELREQIQQRFAQQEGLQQAMSLDSILLGTGSQQLLHLLCEVMINPGDEVWVEAPTYLVFLDTLRRFNARVTSIPLDGQGLDLEILEQQLKERQQQKAALPKFLYLVSPFQNPTGQSLSPQKYHRLLEIARHYQFLIVEDGAYRELFFEKPHAALKSLDLTHECVLHLGSFSKCFSPGLRVGYALGNPVLLQAMLQMKGSHDFGSAHFNQKLLADLIHSQAVDLQAQSQRTHYRQRCKALETALKHHQLDTSWTWQSPAGGIYLWIELPPHTSTHENSVFFQQCLQQNVLIVPGEFCMAPDISTTDIHHMRLSFGVCNEQELQEGVARLAQAWKSTPRSSNV